MLKKEIAVLAPRKKIILIKMCELLDDEIPTLKTFILGPGYVRTKIHEETLRAGDSAGENRQKTLDFLETEGTSMDDIFDCIQWCVDQDREIIGGRNVSVVHDPWRNGGKELASALTKDTNLYKLRRFDAIQPLIRLNLENLKLEPAMTETKMTKTEKPCFENCITQLEPIENQFDYDI